MHSHSVFSPLRKILRMTRPGFLSITLVGCLIGFATAHGASGVAWSAQQNVTAAIALLLALLAHAGANVLNDYHDALNGADAANHQGLFPFTGGARLIQNGEATVAFTRQLGWTLLVMVVAGGQWLAWHSGWGLIAIGLAGLSLGWAYSAPPLALMGRGLGEATVAACWWLVVVGADYTLRGTWSFTPVLVGAGFAVLVANILLINGLPDAESDARVGKRTLAVRLGWMGATRLYAALAVVAYMLSAAAMWTSSLPWGMTWGMGSAPIAWLAYRHLSETRQPQQLRPAIVLTVGTALVHGLLISLGMLLG